MALNLPTGQTNDISFGPAIVFMGAVGHTPTRDVGYIGEDGVSLEMTSEKRVIMQGNPRQQVYSFQQQQNVNITFSSIEWDFNNFIDALGSGVSASATALVAGGTGDSFWFGGDPVNKTISMHIRHAMAVTGNTLDVYVWKAQSNGGVSFPFGADEHSFGYSFTAIAATTSWDNAALTTDKSLVMITRQTVAS